MPDQPVNIRIPADTWAAAQAKDRQEGTTISHLIRVWIENWINATP